MKCFIKLLLFNFGFTLFAQTDDVIFKEYSYAELFEMIESENDSVFKLENAIIRFNKETDSIFYQDVYGISDEEFEKTKDNRRVITTGLSFYNVHFLRGSGFYNIEFKGPVNLRDCGNVQFFNCVFDKEFYLSTNNLSQISSTVQEDPFVGDLEFIECIFKNKSTFWVNLMTDQNRMLSLNVFSCEFISKKEDLNYKFKWDNYYVYVFGRSMNRVAFFENKILGNGRLRFASINNQQAYFYDNVIPKVFCTIYLGEFRGFNDLIIRKNEFGLPVLFKIDKIEMNHDIEWEQFDNNLMSQDGWDEALSLKQKQWDGMDLDILKYWDSTRVKFDNSYKRELSLRSKFRNYYKSNSDILSANAVYKDLKDLETLRLQFLYESNPSFDSYFTLKTNEFLKTFSDYGTRPSKAIIFAIYVILAFALVYIFFPNSWDTQGRKRLIHRYTFFLKYLNKNAGIHEVYLENKEQDLMQYQDFKNLIQDSGKKVPKFFTITALPIYKWAVTGTKLSAKILSKFDIIKGRWEDLPKSKKIWKSILITCVFVIAITYDLMVKALNALMLSLNTFTTLGFGEIPIKGIPRYLAIIQGLIGWFMLTIFSVSLISQLLL